MLKPTHIAVDLEAEAAYVRYHAFGDGRQNTARRIDEGVTIDLGPDGTLLGIELLAFDDRTIALARRAAAEYGAAFPEALPVA